MDVDEDFWNLANAFLSRDGVSRGTIMGFPCLRLNGEFVAAPDHREGDLIVKLPASRVQDLIESGRGEPFAPAGRVFREWVLVSERDPNLWRELLEEGMRFAAVR